MAKLFYLAKEQSNPEGFFDFIKKLRSIDKQFNKKTLSQSNLSVNKKAMLFYKLKGVPIGFFYRLVKQTQTRFEDHSPVKLEDLTP